MKTNPVGRPKSIKSPEQLWGYFQQYAKETKNNPYKIKDWVGKEATEVFREKEQPLTMEGFSTWLYERKIMSNLDEYLANTRGNYTEFSSILRNIRNAIRKDQIAGGMAGVYNASLTARLNNLVDRNETTVVKEQPLFGDEPTE